jgi:hypothetical protein
MTNFKEMLFSVQDDGLCLHLGNGVVLEFSDVKEWEDFANNMLGMIPELTENIEQR